MFDFIKKLLGFVQQSPIEPTSSTVIAQETVVPIAPVEISVPVPVPSAAIEPIVPLRKKRGPKARAINPTGTKKVPKKRKPRTD
jgi:hypothetical protein